MALCLSNTTVKTWSCPPLLTARCHGASGCASLPGSNQAVSLRWRAEPGLQPCWGSLEPHAQRREMTAPALPSKGGGRSRGLAGSVNSCSGLSAPRCSSHTGILREEPLLTPPPSVMMQPSHNCQRKSAKTQDLDRFSNLTSIAHSL